MWKKNMSFSMISSRWKDQQLDHAADMASVHLKRSALGWDYHRLLRSTEGWHKEVKISRLKKTCSFVFPCRKSSASTFDRKFVCGFIQIPYEVRATATCPALGKKVAENDLRIDVFWCDEFLCPPVAIGLVSREKARTSSQDPMNFTPESICWNQEPWDFDIVSSISTKFSALSSFGASHFPSHFSALFVGSRITTCHEAPRCCLRGTFGEESQASW